MYCNLSARNMFAWLSFAISCGNSCPSARKLQRAAIHPQQHELLLVLAGQPKDAEVTMAAERMFLRHNSTVELVDRCVKQGPVTRLEDPMDRRRSTLRLNARGEELLQVMAPYHLRELEEFGPKLIDVLSGIAPPRPSDRWTALGRQERSSDGMTSCC
jgi:DNA-binding MarR family transcriptional regulator